MWIPYLVIFDITLFSLWSHVGQGSWTTELFDYSHLQCMQMLNAQLRNCFTIHLRNDLIIVPFDYSTF